MPRLRRSERDLSPGLAPLRLERLRPGEKVGAVFSRVLLVAGYESEGRFSSQSLSCSRCSDSPSQARSLHGAPVDVPIALSLEDACAIEIDEISVALIDERTRLVGGADVGRHFHSSPTRGLTDVGNCR
jgi:hypothetical protein